MTIRDSLLLRDDEQLPKGKEMQNTLGILEEAMELLENKTSGSFTEPEQLSLFQKWIQEGKV